MSRKGVSTIGSYLYETHLHTSEASACAAITGAEQVKQYKEAGYSGIIVTDHFFNGNSCIPKDLPWEERIDLFCRGYENAKAEGDRLGLDVFFGMETNFNSTEFLIYGITKEWLKAQPDMLSWSIQEQYERVQEAGGFIVHAHPFRIRPYIKEIRLFPQYVDGVEVINVGNQNHEYDRKAANYAREHNLPKTAGTDTHGYPSTFSGMSFRHKLTSIQNFISNVREGKCQCIEIG